MSQIIFIRHFKPIIDPHTPVEQWKLSKDALQAIDQDIIKGTFSQTKKILTSPEPKAKMTAQRIATTLSLPLEIREEIKEVDRSKAGFIDDYVTAITHYLEESPNCTFPFEPITQVKTRISKFVNYLETQQETPLVVVSHGIFLSLLLHKYFEKDVVTFWKELGFGEIILVDSKKLIAIF